MGDLISRSALLNVIAKMNFDFGNDTDDTETIIEMISEEIDNQPTAYDVEKVVAELEERLQFYEKRFAEMSGTDRDVEDWGSIKSYKDAIDIVKRGGIDES